MLFWYANKHCSVVLFLLGDSPASEFHEPTSRDAVNSVFTGGIYLLRENRCSETSAHEIHTPRDHPKERIQHSEHGESLKSISTALF
jgi:hypothetical protein